jgi:hypothetical protein
VSTRVLIAVVGGALSAILYLIVALGSPGAFILAYLAQLPLFLVGLSLGLAPAVIASTAGTLVVLTATSLTSAALYVVLTAGAAAVVVRQALLNRPNAQGGAEWYPPGLLIAWLTLAGLVLLGVAGLYAIGAEGGLHGLVRDRLSAVFNALAPGQEEAVAPAADLVARILPGVTIVSWIVMLVVNITLAQGLLVRVGRALRPSPVLAHIWLPRWPAYGLIAAIACTLLPGEAGMLGQNAAIILAVPFLFLGLGVCHAWAGRATARLLLLFLLYVVLVLTGWPVLFVAALGFIEQWVGLRRRFAGPSGN